MTAFCLRSGFKDSAIDTGVDVATGKDSSNSLAGDLCVLLKQCCECCRPCALRYIVGGSKVGAHRCFDRIVADFDYALDLVTDQVECAWVGPRNGDAVGDTSPCWNLDNTPGQNRTSIGWGFSGDSRDNFRRQAQRVTHRRQAGCAGPPAHWNVNKVQVGQSLEQLQSV